ncbi:MAG TPA: low temperature requirement protein A [Actinomycetes bacterium]|nr:low temperature requirement protein A [Actinomycetes bacterium]
MTSHDGAVPGSAAGAAGGPASQLAGQRSGSAGARLSVTDATHRVTATELFFDLVFVYAITQVTTLVASDPTALQLSEGVLLLALLWWCWCCFAWLGNAVRADRGVLRVVLITVMALMLVIAIVLPESFDERDSGLQPAFVFVGCYALVRLLHLLIYLLSDPGNPELRRVLRRALTSLLPSLALLAIGAAMPTQGGRLTVWTIAFVADAIGVYLTGSGGWQLHSAAHWAERHGLILLIALGESIVAIGIGVGGIPVSWSMIVAVVLGVAVTASLWWLYFDAAQARAEHRLAALAGRKRTALARDGYTYLHFVLLAGIVLTALGLKKIVEYAADPEHAISDPLTGIPAWALTGGVGVYLLGLTAFRLLTAGDWSVPRAAVGAVLLVALPVVEQVPALGALAGLAVGLAALAGYETRRREADEELPAAAG